MSMTHYKLPVDTEVDKDILEWINSFPRTKKGEMVRHAIRYYISQLEEGETIKFPSTSSQVSRKVEEIPKQKSQPSQSEQNRKERKKPVLNINALK